MRLAMMGTGPFALPTFQQLFGTHHQVVALLTQPPREAEGRRAAAPSTLRAQAQRQGIPILDPLDVNDPDFAPQLDALRADLWVVADYGQILSPETLGRARLGGINLHGSLLPRYRGAAPIQWAMWNGDPETGVTVIHMTPRLDAGPLLAQQRLEIRPEETAPQLETRLAELGAPLVLRVIDDLEAGRAEPLAQSAEAATRARRLRKSDGAIDWSRSAQEIVNQVRALEPWPRTFTYWHRGDGPPLRLILGPVSLAAASDAAGQSPPLPGTVCRAGEGRLVVATGSGPLEIHSAQPAGRKLLPAAELLRGYPMAVGDRLGPEV